MVLALILQSALILKLVLCDHDSSINTSSNQSDDSDDNYDPVVNTVANTVGGILMVGGLVCYYMQEKGIGCFRKSEELWETGTGREEVTQLLLNSNLN